MAVVYFLFGLSEKTAVTSSMLEEFGRSIRRFLLPSFFFPGKISSVLVSSLEEGKEGRRTQGYRYLLTGKKRREGERVGAYRKKLPR